MDSVRSNLNVTGVSKAEGKKRIGQKQYLKKIVVKIFPKVMENLKS